MAFRDRGFSTPIYEENSIEEKKFIIIACEGAETEYQYFTLIKNELNLKATVKMEIFERDEANRNSSAPTQVVKTLQSISKEKLHEIKIKNLSEDAFDIYWAVVDRETQESKKVNLLKAKEICENEGYNLALTNPSFEFWLMLHIVDISTYNKEELLANKKITSKKCYLEKELSNILGSYSKVNIKKEDFITLEKLKHACMQEKFFENEVDSIINNLGSNLGTLIEDIVELN
jgi:hypothetical protein